MLRYGQVHMVLSVFVLFPLKRKFFTGIQPERLRSRGRIGKPAGLHV